jgi:hypothetical protein
MLTRDVAHDERERGKVLDSKVARVIGFVGVILALDATLASSTLEQFREPYKTLLPSLYLAAITLLVLSALAAIVGGMIPQKTAAIDRNQFEQIADGPLMLSEPIPVKQTLIRSYGFELRTEAGRNTRKANWLHAATVLLALGFVAVAAQAATLGAKALS